MSSLRIIEKDGEIVGVKTIFRKNGEITAIELEEDYKDATIIEKRVLKFLSKKRPAK